MRPLFCIVPLLALGSFSISATTVTIDDSAGAQKQVIDGFGTCINDKGNQEWYQKAYDDDLGCSIIRMDLTPQFRSPYSDSAYNSTWLSNQPPLKIADTTIQLPDEFSSVKNVTAITASNGNLWKESTIDSAQGQIKLSVPGYGVVTLVVKR